MRQVVIIFIVIAGIILTAHLSACKKKSKEPAGSDRLVSLKEIENLEKRFIKQVEENKNKSCVRAVLRGNPNDGIAGPFMILVVEGSEETKSCFDLLKEKPEALTRALFEEDEFSGKKDASRKIRKLRSADDPEYDKKLIGSVITTCRPLIDVMRMAVTYSDACSPYIAGKRGMPEMMIIMRLANVLSAAALELSREGKNREAFELLLDGLRFNQDMSRGGVNWLTAMITLSADTRIISAMTHLLGSSKSMDLELLLQLQKELSTLIDTEPHPSTIMQGEYRDVVLHMLKPLIKGKSWAPPGGWHADEKPRAGVNDPAAADTTYEAETIGADEADDNALVWLSLEELVDRELRACPPSSTPQQCYEEFVKFSHELSEKAPGNTLDRIKNLSELLLSFDQKAKMREQVIEILQSIASTTTTHRYIALHGQRQFFLAALRLQAAFRLMAEKSGTCPVEKDFQSEPLKGLAVDPNSIKPMKVSPIAGGKFSLSMDSFRDARDIQHEFIITCHK